MVARGESSIRLFCGGRSVSDVSVAVFGCRRQSGRTGETRERACESGIKRDNCDDDDSSMLACGRLCWRATDTADDVLTTVTERGAERRTRSSARRKPPESRPVAQYVVFSYIFTYSALLGHSRIAHRRQLITSYMMLLVRSYFPQASTHPQSGDSSVFNSIVTMSSQPAQQD